MLRYSKPVRLLGRSRSGSSPSLFSRLVSDLVDTYLDEMLLRQQVQEDGTY